VVSWVGSEGTALLGVSFVRSSRGSSAELDETDETMGSETLLKEAVKSGTVAEL